jgi:DNA repair protein RadC
MGALQSGLMERAVEFGVSALADVETLELFLARAAPSTAKERAEKLMERFGSLSATLAADRESIAKIVGAKAAVDLKLLYDTTRRVLLEPLKSRPVIASWSALTAYVKAVLADRPREEFRVLFLDKKNKLLADVKMAEGTVDHAPVYPREVIRKALEFEASALILVHNHPSGDPTPSSADVDMTRQIIEAGRALRIAVHDHLVVGANGVASLRALGLM